MSGFFGWTFFKGSGFINEHDRDIVPNFIYETAGLADKSIFFFIELERSLALGTGDNVKQFLFDHDVFSMNIFMSEHSIQALKKLIVV